MVLKLEIARIGGGPFAPDLQRFEVVTVLPDIGMRRLRGTPHFRPTPQAHSQNRHYQLSRQNSTVWENLYPPRANRVEY